MASNRKLGNEFESEFCEMLYSHGYWTHNMAQNQAGQPADVIAVKNKKAYLIDCKVCANDRFQFSRMESNQRMAMKLWKDCGNGKGWFALRLSDGKVYMIDFELMFALGMNRASMGRDLIEQHGTPLEKWIEYENMRF